MRRSCVPVATALLALGLGCHREPEMVPLIEKTIYITDRFYDVQALSTDRAFIVGYGGKIIETTDGGRSWEGRPSGIETALYAVRFTDDQHCWVVGQRGVVLHTADRGETWHEQERTLMEGTGIFDPLDIPPLFGIQMRSSEEGLAAGLEGHLARTRDGGRRWGFEQIEVEYPLVDPLFRVLEFADGTGWATGAAGEGRRKEGPDAPRKRAKAGPDGPNLWERIAFSGPHQ